MVETLEIKLPKLGESIVSATIVQWFKKVGDEVVLDEPLLEVSTDKVNSEIPSPVSGTLTKLCADVGEELDVGAVLAHITCGEEAPSAPSTESAVPPLAAVEGGERQGMYTPVVLRLAKERGLSLSELARIPATGAGGRLSKRDVEGYLAQRKEAPLSGVALSELGEGEERLPLSPMRKMVAEAICRSFYEAPHATLVSEVDVTALLTHIQKDREAFFKEHGCKLTITSYLAQAIARSVAAFPHINASLEGETLVVKREVNLGIAVNVDGGIVVPVISRCDRRPLSELAKEVEQLSEGARSQTLNPMQVQKGTLTMTNFGMGGALIGIPIIRYPEVAIVGVGAITKKVVALEGDAIGVRSRLYLSLAFDHRVIDGMYGCGFLAEVKRRLEAF